MVVAVVDRLVYYTSAERQTGNVVAVPAFDVAAVVDVAGTAVAATLVTASVAATVPFVVELREFDFVAKPVFECLLVYRVD